MIMKLSHCLSTGLCLLLFSCNKTSNQQDEMSVRSVKTIQFQSLKADSLILNCFLDDRRRSMGKLGDDIKLYQGRPPSGKQQQKIKTVGGLGDDVKPGYASQIRSPSDMDADVAAGLYSNHEWLRNKILYEEGIDIDEDPKVTAAKEAKAAAEAKKAAEAEAAKEAAEIEAEVAKETGRTGGTEEDTTADTSVNGYSSYQAWEDALDTQSRKAIKKQERDDAKKAAKEAEEAAIKNTVAYKLYEDKVLRELYAEQLKEHALYEKKITGLKPYDITTLEQMEELELKKRVTPESVERYAEVSRRINEIEGASEAHVNQNTSKENFEKAEGFWSSFGKWFPYKFYDWTTFDNTTSGMDAKVAKEYRELLAEKDKLIRPVAHKQIEKFNAKKAPLTTYQKQDFYKVEGNYEYMGIPGGSMVKIEKYYNVPKSKVASQEVANSLPREVLEGYRRKYDETEKLIGKLDDASQRLQDFIDEGELWRDF